MKKVNETPEKLLIYQDEDLHKFSKETLKTIFAEVETLKTRFNEIEIPFNPANFNKTIQDGCQWIEDELFNKLVENNYKGLSQKIIDSKVPKDQFKEFVTPIDEIVVRIKGLLNKIDISADQVPFDEKNEPIINAELKNLLSEASKRYAIGANEIELFHTIEEFILICNKLEKSLAKNGFPLLFTKYTDFSLPMLNAESDTFAYPLALANYDNVLNDGHAALELNPEYFENIRTEMKALMERQKLEREMRSLPPEVRFKERSSDINVDRKSTRLNSSHW
jgi:hypothetical protein